MVCRSLRVLTGLAMATILLALGTGGWHATVAGPPATTTPRPAAVATAQATDFVLLPGSVEIDERSTSAQTADHLPRVDQVGSLDTPPLRTDRPSWTPVWKPAADPYAGSAGQRAPPRG